MLRRFVSAAAVLFIVVGFVLAGEYRGIITEHKDGKITVKVGKKGEEPTEKTFKIKKDVKISKKGKDGDEDIKAEDFKEILEKGVKGKAKGVGARITTEGEGDAETVTAIVIQARGKKGK
ncbi:MAG: hypothetical protein U0797_24665 [Gemmataceae bacterium]